MPSHTHYDNLKVSRTAPIEVIKASYRTLLQKYHPDKNNNSSEATRITKIINHAYELLSDPVKRAAYDEELKQEELEEQEALIKKTASPIQEPAKSKSKPESVYATTNTNTKLNFIDFYLKTLTTITPSFTIKGRASRKEYWIFNAGNNIVLLIFGLIASFLPESDFFKNGILLLFLSFICIAIAGIIDITIRRLHDTGRSGWWLLLDLFLSTLFYKFFIILIIINIYLIILMCLPTDINNNIYGENNQTDKISPTASIFQKKIYFTIKILIGILITISLLEIINYLTSDYSYTKKETKSINNKSISNNIIKIKDGKLWLRCSLGQSLADNKCIGEAKRFTFNEAQQAAKDFNMQSGFSGYTDWRVPTIRELSSLRECSTDFNHKTKDIKDNNNQIYLMCNSNSSSPTINLIDFPTTPNGGYWSSSQDIDNTAWRVGFGNGYVSRYNYNTKYYVRLVRTY